MRVILGRESSLSGSDSFSRPGLCLKDEKEKRRPSDIASVRAQSGSQWSAQLLGLFWNSMSGIYAKYPVQIMLLFVYTTT